MKCPNCSKPVEWRDNPYRPFCSEHCKLVDLGRWVNDEYAVPGEPLATSDQEESPAKPAADREAEW